MKEQPVKNPIKLKHRLLRINMVALSTALLLFTFVILASNFVLNLNKLRPDFEQTS